MQLPRHQDPAHAHAALTGVRADAGADEHREGRLDVRVAEQDRRRLAAQLEHAGFDQRPADLADAPADLRRAREAHHVNAGVTDQMLGGRGAGGNDVNHAGWKADIREQVAHAEDRQRVLLWHFDDHRAACDQRRSRLLAHCRQREVVGAEQRGDADGLLHDKALACERDDPAATCGQRRQVRYAAPRRTGSSRRPRPHSSSAVLARLPHRRRPGTSCSRARRRSARRIPPAARRAPPPACGIARPVRERGDRASRSRRKPGERPPRRRRYPLLTPRARTRLAGRTPARRPGRRRWTPACASRRRCRSRDIRGDHV